MTIPSLLIAVRKRLPLSPEGLGWFVLTTGMLLTGLLKNINLITLLGCILLSIGVVNLLLAWRQIHGVRVDRDLPPYLIAGQPNRWVVRVVQKKPRVRRGLLLDDSAPGSTEIRALDLEAHREQIFERDVVPPRRGLAPLEPVVLSCGYPFGLIALERRGVGGAIAVAPRLGILRRGIMRRWLSQKHATIGAVRSRPIRHPTGKAEFHGLRPFRSGDSPRHVHWRTSARRGELMVREFEEHPNDDLVLIVDLSRTDPAPSDAFERTLSLAATVVWEWCRQKGDRLTVILASTPPLRFHGPTGEGVCVDAFRALAVAAPSDADQSAAVLAMLDEFPMPATTHLLLAETGSPLTRALQAHLGRTVVAIDVGFGEELDFFELASSGDGASGFPLPS